MLLVKTMDKVALEKYTKNYASLIGFLVLELLFFVAMNLADYGVFFRLVTTIIAIASAPFFLKNTDKNRLNDLFVVVLPLVLYAILVMFSPMVGTPPNGVNYAINNIYLSNNLLEIGSIGLGLVAFFMLGYAIGHSPDFKISYGLLALFGGFTVLLFISLTATLWGYGFFYREIYKGMEIFYNATGYLVSEQVKWLHGFSVIETSVDTMLLITLLLGSSVTGLFFIKQGMPKKGPLIIGLVAGLGVLTLIVLPSFESLIFLVPALVLTVYLKFVKKPFKYLKQTVYIGGGLLGLLVVIGFLNALNVQPIANLISGNTLTNKLFNNYIVANWSGVIADMFNYPFGSADALSYAYDSGYVFSTNNIVIDVLRQTGIVGFIAFLTFIVIAVKVGYDYYKKSTDAPYIKVIILSYLLTFFVFTVFNYPYKQYIYTEGNMSYFNHFPLFTNLPFSLGLFLVGYMHAQPKQEVEVKTNETQNTAAI